MRRRETVTRRRGQQLIARASMLRSSVETPVARSAACWEMGYSPQEETNRCKQGWGAQPYLGS